MLVHLLLENLLTLLISQFSNFISFLKNGEVKPTNLSDGSSRGRIVGVRRWNADGVCADVTCG